MVLLALAVLVPFAPARAQVVVQPRRAYKSPVRDFHFEWRFVDILGEPAPDGAPAGGGLRLYFYERERSIAELAVPLIEQSYAYLREQFAYAPSMRFPFILYNTYQEFLETNLFPLAEGVLGVTSPQDLTLTLPYFGDHRRFVEVGTHELAHQFTIQKVRDAARRHRVRRSPLEEMPLWFIEGLAEYYAQRGLDPEAELLARDLVVNPDAEHGYVLQGFFDDRRSFLWTYKLGQARVAFLEETYGAGTTQRVLAESPRLAADLQDGIGRLTFAELLAHITGDDEHALGSRFADWLKRRSFAAYLEAAQSPDTLVPLERDLDGELLGALSASPDGNLLLYRRIWPDTGQTQLVLVDRRAPRKAKVVVSDGVPGVDSLHPIAPRNFELGRARLVFVAETDSRDTLYVQRFAHRVDKSGKIVLELSKRTRYDLREHARLIAVDAPSLSPEGDRIAFVGTDEQGFRDVYVLDPREPVASVTRVTRDVWAERQLSWGPHGIVFTSDMAASRKYNLFLVDPDAGDAPVQLTDEDRDLFDPLALADGRVFFVAYGGGRADVHELASGEIIRRTSVGTGLGDLAPGPDGGLWAWWLHAGRRRPVLIANDELLLAPVEPAHPSGATAELEAASLATAEPYRPASFENWRLARVFGLIGAGGGGLYGQLLASATDRMRDHAVVLSAAVYGRPDLIDGMLLYINQAHRLGVGLGAFQDLTFQIDRTFDAEGVRFSAIERFFGAAALLRLPFGTYRYVEGQLAFGGVQHTLEDSAERFLADGSRNGTGEDLLGRWRRERAGTRLQGEARLRLGHDTVRYHRATGPLAGSSVLLEGSLAARSRAVRPFGELRLDVARYVSLAGPANFSARLGLGTTYGGDLARQFYLSSFDTLRGVEAWDADFLLGRHYAFSAFELQLPLAGLVQVAFLPNLEAIVGLDVGAAGDELDVRLWDKRVVDVAAGVNFIFGPLVLRLHFAKPLDTGADARRAGLTRRLPGGRWVTNLSLNWLYF